MLATLHESPHGAPNTDEPWNDEQLSLFFLYTPLSRSDPSHSQSPPTQHITLATHTINTEQQHCTDREQRDLERVHQLSALLGHPGQVDGSTLACVCAHHNTIHTNG